MKALIPAFSRVRPLPAFMLLVLISTLLLYSGCAATKGGGTTGGQNSIPAIPAGLSATGGNAQVALAWSPSANATGYSVKRSTTTGGPYTQISAPAAATFTDSGLTNGTKYFYVVSASNSAGQSANSAEASATPTAPDTPPATPTSLRATAGNTQVSLAWSASSGATSYHVKRSTMSGAEVQIASPSTNNFVDTGVVNGTKYFYEVSAVNSSGESANSAEVNATPVAPQTAPPTPANLQALAGNAQVSLTWSASAGATNYHVKRSTSSGAETQIAAPTANTFTDTTTVNGTKYFYVVSALNSVGESANSNEVSATPTAPATVPATPTGLAATPGNAQISLTWNASTGANSYHVKRSTTR